MPSTKPIKVGLVQMGDRFGDQYYLPYSIGVLQAYAQKNLKASDNFHFMLPLYKKISLADAVNYLLKSDVVFFSAYIWNYQISLEIARMIKQFNPGRVVVFGGPQVPESSDGMERFLRKHRFIDIASFGEGEMPFLAILENFEDRAWDNVPAVGFLGSGGKFKYNGISSRIDNLDTIPSPYLNGIFDPLLESNPTHGWSALLETNRGCPYSCVFCYWGKKSKNKVYFYEEKRVYQEIDWFSSKKIEFLFCCDANFGLFARDVKIARKIADNKSRFGYPSVFSIQNTKNSTDKIFLLQKTLNDAGLQKGVNLAFQSLNMPTLQSIKRNNITIDGYKELQQKFTKNNIPTFNDLILGLQDETYDSFVLGVSNLIDSGQHNRIQFINLAVLENTEMSEDSYLKRYGLIVKETEFIPHHSSVGGKALLPEKQRLVIATDTMPKEQWRKCRVFSWMASLLYFNKLLQAPFILLRRSANAGYKELIDIFMGPSQKYRVLQNIYSLFYKKAQDIQRGGPEFVASRNWLNIWWPVDEYVFIKLCREARLDEFYDESGRIIKEYFKKKGLKLEPQILDDAIKLNRVLIKLPFINNDLDITLSYNIATMYYAALAGSEGTIKKGVFHYTVDRTSQKWGSWEEWMREVVWYGTKKGAYLYNFRND